jgi:hypothetical protein
MAYVEALLKQISIDVDKLHIPIAVTTDGTTIVAKKVHSRAQSRLDLFTERWSHAQGELASLTPRDTEVAVLLRGRTLVDRVGSGMRQITHGRPGTVWLCPSGIKEEFINVAESIEDCLHIFLPGRPFDETMLRDLDVDPRRVELRYEAVDQDPFIDHVAAQIAWENNYGTTLPPLGAFHRQLGLWLPRRPAPMAKYD